ncbi:hypothetical protein WA158_001341 [Blastocystis sp. Blastoise]
MIGDLPVGSTLPTLHRTNAKGGPTIRFMTSDIKALFPHVDLPEYKSNKKPHEAYDFIPVGPYLSYFEKETPAPVEPIPDPTELKKQRLVEKMVANQEKNIELRKTWDPKNNPKATRDPFKTAFVGNLNYDVDEQSLRREFERCGPIASVVIIRDLEGKSRGYAFVEFKNEKDLKRAYDDMNARRFNGRVIMVDVERGRTVNSWIPRRLGGGRGQSRKDMPKKDRSKLALKKAKMEERMRRAEERRYRQREEERRMAMMGSRPGVPMDRDRYRESRRR